MPSSPRRRGVDLSLLLVLVLGALSGPVARWASVDLQLFGDTADAGDYRTGALAVLVTAVALAVLGALVAHAFRASAAVWGVLALLVVLDLALAASTSSQVAGTEPASYPVDVMDAVSVAAAAPTGWPLLALSLAAVLVDLGRLRRTTPA